MKINKTEIIKKYFNTDNVIFDFKDMVQLDKNEKSPFFIDINGILSHPGEREFVKGELCRLIDKEGLDFDLAAGADHSGIPFTVIIGSSYGKPLVYIRNTNKKHGKQNKTEGRISGGERAVLFTDYYSSASKIDFAFDALADAGATVKAVLTVFNYTDEREYNGIPIISLFDRNDFLETLKSEKLVHADIERKLGTGSGSGANVFESNMGREGAEILLEINAVTLSVEKPYRYASGILSPIYCDNRLLISYPDKWEKVISFMINIIETKIGLENIDIIGGTSTAGIPHSVMIAEKLKKPLIYIKSETGNTGKMSEIEGNMVSGKRVLIVEDLISKGGSAIRAVEMVREKNGNADNCLAIFTYEMESSRKLFEENRCSVYTVSGFSKLIETAAEIKYINSSEMQKALDWNSDPENWGRKHGFE